VSVFRRSLQGCPTKMVDNGDVFSSGQDGSCRFHIRTHDCDVKSGIAYYVPVQQRVTPKSQQSPHCVLIVHPHGILKGIRVSDAAIAQALQTDLGREVLRWTLPPSKS